MPVQKHAGAKARQPLAHEV